MADLEQNEAERARLPEALHAQPKKLEKVVSFLPNTVGRFKALVTDLAATVTRCQVDRARMILRELVGQQIPLHPTANGKERYLTAELGDCAGLIRLIFGQNKFGGGQGDRTTLPRRFGSDACRTGSYRGGRPPRRLPMKGAHPLHNPQAGGSLSTSSLE